MNKVFLSFVASIVMLASCQRDVELDVPAEAPKIVVNGVLMNDSTFRVHLSESRFILDIRPQSLIENATIQLVEEGVAKGYWTYVGEGVYEAHEIVPMAGKHYELQVSAPKLASVVAEAIVPGAVSNVIIKAVDSTMAESSTKVRIRLEIQDPAASVDYYVIHRVSKYATPEGVEEPLPIIFSNLMSESPAIFSTCNDEYGYDPFGCKIMFTDRTFDGGEREFVVTYSKHYWDDGIPEDNYLVISRVTEAYYQYLLSIYHNDQSGDNPFAEPVPLYMNVAGGYGILGASSSKWMKLP